MTWQTKDYRTYPSHYAMATRRAAALYPNSYHFGAYNTRKAASAEALALRKYRWLIRNHPGLDFKMDSILEENDFRTKIVSAPFGVWELYLVAKPTLLREIMLLNPELRSTIPV